ncbi:bifunctional riboflavin kinase/FAD synthetase [Flavobacterium psychrophilum]|uniref:Riboflavin biosynthesis protein n=1 Tax=Flavobacterium psychrophilum TaxID=96345 RepID=D8PJS8_FLAPS|nr:bifunctional riboflavin kinase/FAD synthetase [Flavobacterium psychrophilum]AIN73168.1 riboflavin biosynthesis protein RibF [Flavobacterium psychrophilum FPG3]EKT2070088.1 bifunctional riboflavin kinase/FAD synthetase [Flavobacterium psychrophilum]EKT2072221.1 bifunctional riboflavin kinase/FAD synthetase [Flavobacterium psychrophilum]EKT4491649.1 bifunctional riboflavin kinase/FAD synthetase [Flavobacterium psychrophilum]MBF2045190.1 bifunctional riboflavin kinase/FAD synthetase [Flavobact
MKVFYSISDFKCEKKTVATLGTFDGVHLGHQKIISRLLNNTQNKHLESVVLTFSQHPRSVLQVESNIKLLNTNAEKIALLEKKGIDNLIIHPFDASFSELTGEDFVKNILVDQLNIKKIIIGYDHRFGKNRASDIHDLIYFGKKYHFDVEQISAKEIDEISISSTKIRKAIQDANIKLANQYLGYNYLFAGNVIRGQQLGRTIGFPTANISIENTQKIIPKNGVYIVEGSWQGKNHQGMMNIGTKPTVDGKNTTIEVHFFNLNEDLYNLEITISVCEFIRAEVKFNSIEELKRQLQQDKIISLDYFFNRR